MPNYACYIFGWNESPGGGTNDLLMCCDTIDEGISNASRLSSDYDIIQLMDATGEIIEEE